MNASANLDIRYPIGSLFLILGALLMLYGLLFQGATTPLSSNIDFWWGLVLLVFGALLLALARAASLRSARTVSHSESPTEES